MPGLTRESKPEAAGFPIEPLMNILSSITEIRDFLSHLSGMTGLTPGLDFGSLIEGAGSAVFFRRDWRSGAPDMHIN